MATVLNQKEITTTTQLADGSLEESRKPVFVYVHCYNQVCTKYHNLQSNLNFERKLPGVRQETQYTYKDRGGDAPGIENSHVRWFVADENGKPITPNCEECGSPLNVSGTPSYKLASYGVGPGTGLKGAERAAALAAAKVAEDNKLANDQVASLQVQLEAQQKLLESLIRSNTAEKKPNTPGKSTNG